jgi:hypothetical protein
MKHHTYFLTSSVIHSIYSEIIAHNAFNLLSLWESQTISGSFQGNPIVSSDGLYTFIVTNSMNKTKGNFIVIDNFNGSTIFSESSGDEVGRPIAYAPLGVGRNVARGNWNKGGDNNNDMLVWGELYVEGRGEEDSGGVTWFDGAVHYLQLPSNFSPNNIGTDLVSQTGNAIRKTTLSSPVVPKHGMGAYFSFNSGQIRGWSKGMCM